MFATLRSVSKGRNHGFADRDKSRARPFNASTLTTYASTFEKQRQGVGEQIGLRNPGIPAEPRQAVALRRLEFLDYASRRMIALGQLDRRIGHVAAAAIAERALGAATNPSMKLRERVIGMGGFKSIPDRLGVSGDVAQARNHQIVGQFRLLRRAQKVPPIEKPRRNDDAEQADPPDEQRDRKKVAQHESDERGVDEIDELERGRPVEHADLFQ